MFLKINKILIFCFFIEPLSVWSQTCAKIVGVKDGDTVVALLDGNVQKTLRLAEVDCPENGQPFGKNAKQFTSSQVLGKEIIFFETSKDRYGRSIAKIYYDKKYLSAEIIKAGFGWWYSKYSDNPALGKLENAARARKAGLWSDPNAVAPWEFRKLNRKKNLKAA